MHHAFSPSEAARRGEGARVEAPRCARRQAAAPLGLHCPRPLTVLIPLATALLAVACGTLSAAGQDSPRPNIVLLVADDLGYGELGCQGNPQIPTPHIDSLAAQGVRFTAGYVTASYCSASRAGLMTGRFPTRFGYEFNPIGHHNEDPEAGLPPSEKTLAECLHDAGYATALIGKWHLGGHARFHPQRHGFDEFFGFTHEGHYYLPPPYRGATTMLRRRSLPDGGQGRWISRDGSLVLSTHMRGDEPAYDANNPLLRGGQPVAEPQYLTDAWTREAVDFIRRRREQPFFLCLAYNAVHSPLQGAEAYMRKFAHIEDVHRRIFAAMLANLDDSVGEVLRTLRDCGLDERTLVVFISDNGGPTRELTSSNLPLRGGKGDVYEGGVRVPLLMRWSGRLPAGQVYQQAAVSLDIYATAAAAAAASVPEDRPLDGVDLLPYLTGRQSGAPHERLFWRLGRRTALREGDWKLLRNARRGAGGEDDWELYNLAEDLSEKHDLRAQHPQRFQSMRQTWQQLNDQMAPPLWQP